MKRYDQWHHVRLVGDRLLALKYLGEGRKYLGYLVSQRQNDSTQHELTYRNADGILFVAHFAGVIPILTIVAPEGGGEVSEVRLDGFIVRPSVATDQQANTAKNHRVLRPRGGRYRTHFYDPAGVPLGYLLPHGFYGAVPQFPPLFPDGIGAFGNLDWRNTSESVMVTWFGPETRYFAGAGITFDTQVFWKGQPLFDLGDYESALVSLTNGTVRGACLRADPELGPCLYVIALFFDTLVEERLLRFPVQPTAASQLVLARAGSSDWRLAPVLELTLADAPDGKGGGEVLFSWNRSYDSADSEHPWMFNQDGTQARAIHLDEVAKVYEEYLLDFTDETLITCAVVDSYPVPLTVTTTDTTYTAAPTPCVFNIGHSEHMEFSWDGATLSYVGMAVDLPATTEFHAAEQDGPTSDNNDAVLDFDEMTTAAPAQDWIRVAVDFRSNDPVYADARLRGGTIVGTLARILDPLLTTDVVYSGDSYDPGTGLVSLTVDTTQTLEASTSTVASSQESAVQGGIRTDWGEWSSTFTEDITFELDGEESTVYTRNSVATDEPKGFFTPTPPDPPGTYYGFPSGFDSVVENYSGSATRSYSYARTTHDRELLIGYLDLRYQHIVFAELETLTTREATSTKTHVISDATSNGAGYSTGADPDLLNSHTADVTTTQVARVRILRDEVVLFTEDVTINVPTATTPSIAATSASQLPSFGRAVSMPASSFGQYDLAPGIKVVFRVPGTTPPGSADSYAFSDTVVDNETVLPEISPMGDRFHLIYSGGVKTEDYGVSPFLQRTGGWQTYKSGFCFSMALPYNDGGGFEVVHRFGLGSTSTGNPHVPALPELTGALETEVRFHPVSIMTPTVFPNTVP